MQVQARRSEAPGDEGMPSWAVILFIASAVLGLVVIPRLLANHSGLVGKPVPSLTLEPLTPDPAVTTSQATALASLQGRVVVLDFWASWCGPCKAEMPVLERLAKKHVGDSVDVIGVLVDEDRDGARAVLQRLGIHYRQLDDALHTASEAFGIHSLPSLVIVDRKGVVRSFDVGYHDEAALEAAIHDAM